MASYPIGPLLDGGGLNITVQSAISTASTFGFVVCPDIVEDPWQLARQRRRWRSLNSRRRRRSPLRTQHDQASSRRCCRAFQEIATGVDRSPEQRPPSALLAACWSGTHSVRYERPPASVCPLSNPAVVIP